MSASLSVQQEKKELRKRAAAARSHVPPGEREEAAARLAKALPRHPLLEQVRPGPILIPTRHGHEIDTTNLAHALEGRGWQIHRPRVIPGTSEIEAVHWPTPSPLVPGAHDVPEPPLRAPAVDPTTLKVILVPGLAFTREGDRIGTGAGYFDRFLAPLAEMSDPPLTIGLSYRVQLVEELPLEPHDVPLHGIQVEEESILCRR